MFLFSYIDYQARSLMRYVKFLRLACIQRDQRDARAKPPVNAFINRFHHNSIDNC